MNMNPTYTRADPVSLWSTMIIIGTRMMRAAMMKSRQRLILYPSWLITVARSRDVDIFDISAGWSLTGPKANQDRDPLTSIPRKITAMSRTMVSAYMGTENPS